MSGGSEERHSEEFISLLIEQLTGDKGVIAMATRYLDQANCEHHSKRRRVLTSLAKRKMRHAEILGAILISIADYQDSSNSIFRDPELAEVLGKSLIRNAPHKSLFAIFTSLTRPAKKEKGINRHPRSYLTANIQAEDQQIFCYQKLISMTTNKTFLTGLRISYKQQVAHRNELISLLAEVGRHP